MKLKETKELAKAVIADLSTEDPDSIESGEMVILSLSERSEDDEVTTGDD